MSRHKARPGPMRHSAGKVVTWRVWALFFTYGAFIAWGVWVLR